MDKCESIVPGVVRKETRMRRTWMKAQLRNDKNMSSPNNHPNILYRVGRGSELR